MCREAQGRQSHMAESAFAMTRVAETKGPRERAKEKGPT